MQRFCQKGALVFVAFCAFWDIDREENEGESNVHVEHIAPLSRNKRIERNGVREADAMISQRWMVQLGLLASVAVLVTSLGVLISHGGDNNSASEQAKPQAAVAAPQPQNVHITLSALDDRAGTH